MRQDVARAATGPRRSAIALETVMARVCESLGIASAALVAGGRTARVSRARAGIAYLWVTVLGHAGRPLAGPLGIRPQNVYRAAA
jgi:chromosomal replication initiation ATPase DnaA